MADNILDDTQILHHAYMNGLVDYDNYDRPFPIYFVPPGITLDNIYQFAKDIQKDKNGG